MVVIPAFATYVHYVRHLQTLLGSDMYGGRRAASVTCAVGCCRLHADRWLALLQPSALQIAGLWDAFLLQQARCWELPTSLLQTGDNHNLAEARY